jgi:hypothetical protein
LITYSFELQGHIDRDWSEWLKDVVVEKTVEGVTKITGVLKDKSAAYSVISRIRDLGLTLLKVEKKERKV